MREADEAVRVGSYLAIDEIVGAAAGADAIHPGYGFLSENAGVRARVRGGGIVFVGPSPEAIELMGDKVRAKEAAARAGVPVVESLQRGRGAGLGRLPAAGQGRGGRRRARDAGRRVARGLDDAMAAAQREAQAGFGDDRVFIERFLPRARHIEVQVIGDTHGTCSRSASASARCSAATRRCSRSRRRRSSRRSCASVLGDEAVALAARRATPAPARSSSSPTPTTRRRTSSSR